jgi:hypothetical protein
VPSPGVRGDGLAFSPGIEVIPPIIKDRFSEVVRDIFQHILSMDFLQNGDGGVGSISFANMIEPRPIIPPIAHLVELT